MNRIGLSIKHTTDFDGCFKLKQIRLLKKDVSSSSAQLFDLSLRELDLLPWSSQPNLREPSDYIVENRRVNRRLLPLRRRHQRNSNSQAQGE